MYLDDLATVIRAYVPENRVPEGDVDELFRLYAVLLRGKGADVTQSDVHDAWSVWMATRDGRHESLVEYEDLDEGIRAEDRIFATAIRRAADQLGQSGPSRSLFADVLFPSGPPAGDEEIQQTFDLYKIMVESSESLVSRRQAVNTFFLTMNGVLLTAAGLIVQSSGGNRVVVLAIAVLALAGAILCAAWRSLITSFGQLNRGKFQVINTIERYLKAAVYAAEWEALGRGEDPKVYRSFTSREIWVPTALLILYMLAASASAAFFLAARGSP
ncbi:MAG: RipA family octameric membrane protein [Thermoleophilia bacterium]